MAWYGLKGVDYLPETATKEAEFNISGVSFWAGGVYIGLLEEFARDYHYGWAKMHGYPQTDEPEVRDQYFDEWAQEHPDVLRKYLHYVIDEASECIDA